MNEKNIKGYYSPQATLEYLFKQFGEEIYDINFTDRARLCRLADIELQILNNIYKEDKK